MSGGVITVPASRTALKAKEVIFEPGTLLRHGSDIVQIERIDGPEFVLRHRRTYESKIISKQRLLIMYVNEELQEYVAEEGDEIAHFAPDASFDLMHSKSSAAFSHGRSILGYITALRKLGYSSLRPTPILEMDFLRTKEKMRAQEPAYLDLALSTVYKWSRAFDKSGEDPRAVFPDYASRGGRGGFRIDPRALLCLNEAVAKLKADTKAKIFYARIHDSLKSDLARQLDVETMFAVLPSQATSERFIKSHFTPYEIAVRNKGQRFANRKFADHYPRDRAQYALEVVEFDDKDSRTYLINGVTGLPCGRGFITTGVDQATQVPVGISAGDKHRSLVSAMDAFRSCLLPKNLPDIGVEAEFFGPPGIAIFDNALYNHASALERAIYETSNATVAFAKPYTPKEKSKVEDFNGWYGGDKFTKDELKNGMRTAKMTTQEFIDKTLIWAYGEYANTPRGSGLTPRQHWHSLTHHQKLRLPRNLDQFDAAFALEHELRLRDDGVLFVGIPYQSAELKALRKRVGHNARVQFRYHPNDVGKIHVFDPIIRKYFVVRSAIPRFTDGLTLFQHKLIRKIAREDKCRNPAFPEMMKYRDKLRLLTTQKFASTKYHERRRANQIGRIDDDNKASNPFSEFREELVTDLEEAIEQLDLVVLEVQDEEWNLPEDF